MVPARLTVVTLGARDLARLRSFYSALGWEVAIGAEDFCAFQLRGALLALFPREKLAAAYFADPEENYWEVVYLRGDGPGQQAIDRALGEP